MRGCGLRGRRRVSLASAVIVVAALLATWGVAGPAAAVVTKPVVKTASLPQATAGVAYSAKLAASGGIAPYTWSVTQGALPAGLTLVPTTGLIAGIPAEGSSASFTVQATDSENPSLSASASLSITVTLVPLAVTTTSLPSANGGISYSAKLTASGGIAPYTWSVTNGALPAGLSLNAATGAISGKPTAPGTANFTVSVSDAETPPAPVSAALSIAVTVAPLTISTAPLSGATANLAYSVKLAASGGIAPYAWSVTQGALPAGLSLNAATGAISGKPTAPGTASFTVNVSDGENPVRHRLGGNVHHGDRGAAGDHHRRCPARDAARRAVFGEARRGRRDTPLHLVDHARHADSRAEAARRDGHHLRHADQ